VPVSGMNRKQPSRGCGAHPHLPLIGRVGLRGVGRNVDGRPRMFGRCRETLMRIGPGLNLQMS
jgi:hypothetical protein